MPRVSENSSKASMELALQRAKSKLEDLQLKGGTLKKLSRPSDDPTGNIEILTIRARQKDIEQYKENVQHVLTQLSFVENSMTEISDIMVRAKELAISQASEIHNEGLRRSIFTEVRQLKNRLLGIANRRIGNRYLFGGRKTLNPPFEQNGKYKGDNGKTYIEVSKDFFVPVNFTGKEVFFNVKSSLDKDINQFDEFEALSNLKKKKKSVDKDNKADLKEKAEKGNVEKVNVEKKASGHKEAGSLFAKLSLFESALFSNSPEVIQELLENFDTSIDHLITLRTKVGAVYNTVVNVGKGLEDQEFVDIEHVRKIEDADLAKLFSDLNAQNNLLRATYKVGSAALSQTLLDFLK